MRFFSQNDPLWKRELLGPSKCTCGQFGCTTCCIAMGGSYFGEDILPFYLCHRLTYTKDGLIIWQSIAKVFKRMQFRWRFYKFDEALITEGLKNPNKVVLLNVDRGYHWVFLLNKIPLLGYRCVDPYPFPHRVRYYSAKDIVGGAILERK